MRVGSCLHVVVWLKFTFSQQCVYYRRECIIISCANFHFALLISLSFLIILQMAPLSFIYVQAFLAFTMSTVHHANACVNHNGECTSRQHCIDNFGWTYVNDCNLIKTHLTKSMFSVNARTLMRCARLKLLPRMTDNHHYPYSREVASYSRHLALPADPILMTSPLPFEFTEIKHLPPPHFARFGHNQQLLLL